MPLTFEQDADYDAIQCGDQLTMPNINEEIRSGDCVTVVNSTQGTTFILRHAMTPRQVRMIIEGSILRMSRAEREE
ncbi:aconitate hydratase [compost metagenome]